MQLSAIHRSEHTAYDLLNQCPSSVMREMIHLIDIVAPSTSSVLVLGETGVGKELVARAIHDKSPRRCGHYVVGDCAAYEKNLVLSQLFGHERGAFTGAESRQVGFFELANGGTIFLDEIEALDQDVQPRLLRVIESGQYRPLGCVEMHETDVRVVAATNIALEQLVTQGKFRSDLYYRLAVFPITVPPLRDRVEDVPPIAHALLEMITQNGHTLTREAQTQLCSHSWPGNVRELRNVLERAVLHAQGAIEITCEHVAAAMAQQPELISSMVSDAAGNREGSSVGRVVDLGACFSMIADSRISFRQLINGLRSEMMHLAYDQCGRGVQATAELTNVLDSRVRSALRTRHQASGELVRSLIYEPAFVEWDWQTMSLVDMVDNVEWELLQEALRRADGHQGKAAQLLRVNRSTIGRLIAAGRE